MFEYRIIYSVWRQNIADRIDCKCAKTTIYTVIAPYIERYIIYKCISFEIPETSSTINHRTVTFSITSKDVGVAAIIAAFTQYRIPKNARRAATFIRAV